MITTFAASKNIRVAGFAVAAVAIAGVAVAITASAAGYTFDLKGPSSGAAPAAAASPQAATPNACTDFVSHFASDLGTSQGKLQSAFQLAVSQTLADEVASKKLTQAQADAIKKKMTGQQLCAAAGKLGTGHTGGSSGQVAAYAQALMNAAASALGITPAQLKTDLASGQTISQIAAAHNPPISESQFRAALIANLKPLLDTAVTNKQLTGAQEQKILERLQSGPLPYWSRAPKPSTVASPLAA